MSRISDQLLQAFDIAIGEKISKLEYDKTIQATITEIANADEGEYRVKYQEGIISAFAYDPTEAFQIGDSVYVTVPQGDFGNKKFISHKLTNNSLSTGQYKDLANTIIDVSPNFLGLGINFAPELERGLIANDRFRRLQISSISYNINHDDRQNQDKVQLTVNIEGTNYQWQYRKTGEWNNSTTYQSQTIIIPINNLNQNGLQYRCVIDEKIYSTTVQFEVEAYGNDLRVNVIDILAMPLSENFKLYANKYDYVKISAEFMTTLPIDQIPSHGEYGLNFQFRDRNNQLLTCTLDISDFTGDPYNLWTWFPQSTIIELPKDLQSLEGIEFYAGLFDINYEDYPTIPNIYIRNISFSFVNKIDLSDTPYYLSILSDKGLAFNDRVSEITLTGHIIHYGQEINPKSCIYQWFERSLDVIVGEEYYDKRVGEGWAAISNETSQTLVLNANDVLWSQAKFKLLVVYDNNILMTQEVSIFKEELKVEVIQKVVNYPFSNDEIRLTIKKKDETDPNNYHTSWYFLDKNGNFFDVPVSEENETTDIIPYLYFASSTFYCSVYNENWDYLGELAYTIKNMESVDDVTVIFTGTSMFSYDANGDINIYDAELERSLTPTITFNNDISQAVQYKWFLNGVELSGETYTPSDSMIKEARVDTITNTLYYKIKHKFRLYPAVNNTFKLVIITLDDQKYEFEKEIVCTKTGDPGTNGTRYQVLITSNKGYVKDDSTNSTVLTCHVYKDNEELALDFNQSTGNCTNKWQLVNLKEPGTSATELSNRSSVSINTKNYTDQKRYVKLTLTIKDQGERTTLYDFYPVYTFTFDTFDPTKFKLSLLPRYVQYNASGLNPQFLRSNLKEMFPPAIVIEKGDSNQKNITLQTTDSSMYIKAIDKFDPSDSIGLLKITVSEGFIYCPIVMYMNTFGNEAIDGWDGNSVFLGDNNTHAVFAPQVGAGKKENDNTFTGVVMGQDSAEEKIGLYGYQKGKTSFALMEDGTAFFGKAGKGRIEIDGENGTLQGGGGGNADKGMTISLSGEAMTSSNPEAIKLGAGKFIVKYDGSITSTSGTIGGWYITDTTLQDKKLLPSVILDKTDGSIIGANFYAPNKTNYSFRVNGSTGEITAKSGTIGGWSISSTQLTSASNNVVLNSNGTISGATIVGGNIKVPNNSTPAFEVNGQGKLTASGMEIKGDSTLSGNLVVTGNIYSPSSNGWKFKVEGNTGIMSCQDADIKGTITGSEIYIPANDASAKFKVDSTGKMTCTSAEIGGWTIDSNGMHKGEGDYYSQISSANVSSSSDVVFQAGKNFKVYGGGQLVTSYLTASGGTIGGININQGSLTAGGGVFSLTSSGALTCTNANISGSIAANSLIVDDTEISINLTKINTLIPIQRQNVFVATGYFYDSDLDAYLATGFTSVTIYGRAENYSVVTSSG